jgi:hypothetical protein
MKGVRRITDNIFVGLMEGLPEYRNILLGLLFTIQTKYNEKNW